jgi:hypothetical protein
MRILQMLTIFIVLVLILLSCRSSGNFSLSGNEKSFSLEEWLAADYIEEVGEIDNSAEIFIVSQIPYSVFNLFDSSDVLDITVSQTLVRTLRVQVPQDIFFNSILAANQISDFARENPASTRGIFGDLFGIAEVAEETQKVLFGIVPRAARLLDFHFETPLSGDDEMLNHLLWLYNTRFQVSFAENQINMKRMPQITDGSSMISYKTLSSGDSVITVGDKENLSMLLFKTNDLAHVHFRLPKFKISEFDKIKVSAFINPSLEIETKESFVNLLKNTDIYKNLNYELSVFPHERNESERYSGRDSVIIIYPADNPIAFETATVLGDDIKRRTRKKVGVFPDNLQESLFFFDYDIAISAHSTSIDQTYLTRKFLGRALSEEEMLEERLKIDLFEMRTFLLSPQKKLVMGRGEQNIISNLEVVK